MAVEKILAELVAIDSVSTRSNEEIIQYLERRCESLQFKLKRVSYTDEVGLEKINLIAVRGADLSDGLEVELALVGHTDTVPYDPNWSEATTLTLRDNKLYGRGACDTKGFIASVLAAVENIDLEQIQRPLALVFTADEEIGLRGAKYLAQQKVLEPRFSIVGEPTSLRPIRAGKGYSLTEIVVRGREAHSAYPALGASAVFRAARLITRIEALGPMLRQHQHPAFDPPYTTLNVGLIKGGTAKNVIAGECRFTLEWRPVPSQPSDHVLGLLNEAIREERASDPDFDCEVLEGRADSGFETSPESSLVKLLESATGIEAGTVAFGTEAAQMKLLGGDAIVIGPGDIREAHRTGEFVPVDELRKCVDIIEHAIRSICYLVVS
jgi:acetylornithine deacetylase